MSAPTPMTRFVTPLLSAVLMLLLAVLTVDPVAAQTRTLVIDDGVVRIDGERVSDDRMPPSLNLSGIQAQYQFVGISQPIVEIEGRFFAVTDRLQPIPEDSVRTANASVVLRNLERTSPASQERASTMDLQAAHQEYLSDVERRSRKLYERLLREHQMEQQSYELARTIRRLPAGPERQAQIDTLRATLNQIFDLKQENRQREIEQLQRQISELRKSLEKREEMRDEMIEQRLQQLIDASALR